MLSNEVLILQFVHYVSTPMHLLAVSIAKIDNFQLNMFDILLRFAENIVFWYTLEPVKTVSFW